MAAASNEKNEAAARASAWKAREENLKARAYAAQQREFAALGRSQAALARDEAGRMRSDAARIRDDGARTRDEGARVRDNAAVVRDAAAQARDFATKTREESLRKRITSGTPLDRAGWEQVLALDQQASEQSHQAANHDREAAELDRVAAERDREAAEYDRRAAARDRDAAEKDREAADKDRLAADADRTAADADRQAAEREVSFAEDWISRSDRLVSMGQIAATIAHEINNPLTALQLTMEALRDELDRLGVATQIAPMLADVGVAVDRMSTVVADVRSWLGATGETKTRQLVDLAAVIEQSRRLTSAQVQKISKLVIDVQPTPQIYGVATRLGQVITNLVINAAQAMQPRPEGNEVRISVRPAEGCARIEVKDTGAGIPPDVLPHIFDAFFTTKEGAGGTGLGLSLSKRIVAEHGGTLTVQSELGVGTTFTIELPIKDAGSLGTSGGKGRPRVLLIDDDLSITRSLERLLSKDFDVTVTHDGKQGLEALATGAFDVILCDISMPVMNGVEFYSRLRERAPKQAADIVFISGGATNAQAEAVLATLPNVRLTKPFAIERVRELIIERFSAHHAQA